jgi:hypothetical protein
VEQQQAPPVPAPAEPAPAQPGPPAPGAATRFEFRPSAAVVERGATFTVELYAANARDLFAAPFHLKFDPQLVRLQEVKAGPLLAADGRNIIFTRNILNDTGDAAVNLNRMPDTGGISGSGVLAVFTFQAVAPGQSRLMFSQFGLRNTALAEIKADWPQAVVRVK